VPCHWVRPQHVSLLLAFHSDAAHSSSAYLSGVFVAEAFRPIVLFGLHSSQNFEFFALSFPRFPFEVETVRSDVYRTRITSLRCRVSCRGLVSVVVPEPPPWVANEEPAPVFVRFESEETCKKAKEAMNGRTFEANTVTAKYISDDLWQRVKGGEWVDHKFVIDNPTGVPHTLCFFLSSQQCDKSPFYTCSALLLSNDYCCI
jgi:hypothetical protein